jgi:hypothetical protein
MQGMKNLYLYEDSLPLAVPLPKRGYSLEADMLLGWRPKFIKTPILLYYNDELYIDLYKKSCPIVYQGYRPKDSFVFHQELTSPSGSPYPYDFTDKSLTAYNYLNKNKSPSQEPHGMTKEAPSASLIFDSKFEGGNLDQVVMLSPTEYDLYMKPDTNTGTHMHWFYFSVYGFKGQSTVRFNIVNFSRTSPLFKAGMRPKAFSLLKNSRGESSGWEVIGENVTFASSKLNKSLDPGTKKPFFMLTFEFTPLAGDKLWFATTIPYTFSRVWKVIRSIRSDDTSYETSHLKVTILGKSLSLVDIPLLTITNPKSKQKKKVLIAIGRVHPSETVGSWVVEGFFRFLLSRNQDARQLRDKFVFKVIPMCNPDGVIVGNSRTGLSGDDLNRCYLNPSEKFHPEVKLVKELVERITDSGQKIFMFLDFHGHFCKKGSFMYGPAYPLHDANYFQTRIVPKLLSERTCIFRYHSSRFIVERSKKSTARMVMWKEMGIVNTYTLETSYFGYLNEERDTAAFCTENFYTLAEKLSRTILEYYFMQKQERKVQKQKAIERNLKKQRPLPRSKEEKPEINILNDSESSVDSSNEQENQIFDSFSNKVPVEFILPLNIAKEEYVERNIEDVIQMIKQDCSDGEESESQGSCSDSDEVKEAVELPPLERSRRNISSHQSTEYSVNKLSVDESPKKRRWKLNEKFAKRLEQIKEKRKKERREKRDADKTKPVSGSPVKIKDERNSLPQIISLHSLGKRLNESADRIKL